MKRVLKFARKFGDIITFDLAEEGSRLHIKIDVIANGWISGAMSAAEKERIIQGKLHEIQPTKEQ